MQRRKGRFCVIPPRYQDVVRGMEKGARWEEIVDRWPFRKGVDHSRAPGLHLHYIWLEGGLEGLTRGSPMRTTAQKYLFPLTCSHIMTADMTIHNRLTVYKITEEDSSWREEELGPSFKNEANPPGSPTNRISTQRHHSGLSLMQTFHLSAATV